MAAKRYCKRCFETVEAKSHCKICRAPICLTRFGWYHDDTQTFLAPNLKGEGLHAATPGGKARKKQKKVAAHESGN